MIRSFSIHAHRSHGMATSLLSCLLLLIASNAPCQKVDTGVGVPNQSIPYVLDRPILSEKLPRDLKEISGLATVDSTHVAAVQDEDGVVFLIDARSGEVVSRHRFAGNGDYEALEMAGENMFVLRSDGQLFELVGWRRDRADSVAMHSTFLSARYDTEGLALSADGLHLLVACKEYPGKGYKGKRTVYRFSLQNGNLESVPAMVLDAEAAEADRLEGTVSRTIRRLLNIRRFKPSGIAVHPLSGEVYIVSSVARSLTVFDARGTLLSIVQLDKDMLPQPEGIAFLPGGDLLMSTEGDGGRGRLVRFRYFPSR